MSNNSSRLLSRLIARVRRLFYLKAWWTAVLVGIVQGLFPIQQANGSVWVTAVNPSINIGCVVDWSSFGWYNAGAIRIQDGTEPQPQLDLSGYFPLRSGNFWTYRYQDESLYTLKVLPGTKDVCGVQTKIIQDTDGFTEYMTNDIWGIRLHAQIQLPSGTAIVYHPPITIAYKSQADNTTVTSSGTAITPSGNFFYSSSFTTTFTPVNVSTPLGTFTTITQTGTITIGGSTTSFSMNLAKNVGIVRETQIPYLSGQTIELVAMNAGAPADYDGDGRSDIGVYRDGVWLTVRSSDGEGTHTSWGGTSWTPVTADYDGDGITDSAVYNKTAGVWSIIRSSDGGNTVVNWGGSLWQPVPGDYDGDGKTDIAVYNSTVGVWSIIRSSDGGNTVVNWGGASQDVPLTKK